MAQLVWFVVWDMRTWHTHTRYLGGPTFTMVTNNATHSWNTGPIFLGRPRDPALSWHLFASQRLRELSETVLHVVAMRRELLGIGRKWWVCLKMGYGIIQYTHWWDIRNKVCVYIYIYIHMPSTLVMGNILDMDVAENAENGGWTRSH